MDSEQQVTMPTREPSVLHCSSLMQVAANAKLAAKLATTAIVVAIDEQLTELCTLMGCHSQQAPSETNESSQDPAYRINAHALNSLRRL